MSSEQIQDQQGILIGEDTEVSIYFKTFEKPFSYERGVSTTVAGGVSIVSGGGTAHGMYTVSGYEIKVRNNSQETRSYTFKMTVFRDVAQKDVLEEMNRVVVDVKPGYSKTIDVTLYNLEKLTNILQRLYLENIIVHNPITRTFVSENPQFLQMAVEASKNIPPAELIKAARSNRRLSKFLFVSIVGLLGWFVIAEFKASDEKSHENAKAYQESQNALIIADKRNAEVEIARKRAGAVIPIDNKLSGTWKCIEDGDETTKKVSFKIIGNTLTQENTTVQLKPYILLGDVGGTLNEVPANAKSAAYLSNKGGADVKAISSNSMELHLYKIDSGSYKTLTYSCEH